MIASQQSSSAGQLQILAVARHAQLGEPARGGDEDIDLRAHRTWLTLQVIDTGDPIEVTVRDGQPSPLTELANSAPWRGSVVPWVQARQREIQRRLATDTKLRSDSTALIELQTEYRLLGKMLDPEQFFREEARRERARDE